MKTAQTTTEIKMYLMLKEDGTVVRVETITADDITNVDDGLMQIIDVSDINNITFYYEGDWVKLR